MKSGLRRTRVRLLWAPARRPPRLGARGTPATFINGRYLRGARSLKQLKTEVEEEIARAKRLLKLGRITRYRLYELFMAFGKE